MTKDECDDLARGLRECTLWDRLETKQDAVDFLIGYIGGMVKNAGLDEKQFHADCRRGTPQELKKQED